MYIPKPFEITDPTVITSFIRENSFGILTSQVDGEPFATHLPFLYDDDKQVLFAHMAKANPHWRGLDGQQVLVIFPGPHAYISPSWYGEGPAVPTWNYVTAHVRGTCTLIEQQLELEDILEKTTRFYEPTSKVLTQTQETFYQNLTKAIVGFRINIKQIEFKAKLSQNKSTQVRQRIIDELNNSEYHESKVVAQWMS